MAVAGRWAAAVRGGWGRGGCGGSGEVADGYRDVQLGDVHRGAGGLRFIGEVQVRVIIRVKYGLSGSDTYFPSPIQMSESRSV